MPDPVAPVTPATPPTAAMAPNIATVPPAEALPPVDTSPTLLVSENVNGSITMPTISPARIKIQGEDPVDRGDKAEYLVLGTRVGDFLQGSRISADDLGADAAYDRMIEFGVLARLPKVAKPEPASEPAKTDDKKSK